jgi:small nuclear ribonucleoprotein (snRNP)-like protein
MNTTSKLPLVVSALVLAATSPLLAIDAEPGQDFAKLLVTQTGKNVELRLKSGEKLAGKLEKSGDGFINLTQLAGAEYFEAVIRMEDVSAFVVRTKAK